MSGRARTIRDSVAPSLPLRPSATVRRVSLFEREVRVYLSAPALELLFDHAQVLSEGQRQGAAYFGSTMITFALERLADVVRDACDAVTAQRIAELVLADPRVQARARVIATQEVARRLGGPVGRVDLDLKVRLAGTSVHLDLDVQAEVGARA
jgi:hypothetical protein